MRALTAVIYILACSIALPAYGQGNRNVTLYSLNPSEVLTKIDFTRPGLESAGKAAAENDRNGALTALLTYYRNKYPLSERTSSDIGADTSTADGIVNHIFQWGPYEPADYGDEIDWQWDPRGDIEWVAAVYRFHWALPLERAYFATRDEKYARAFVELTADWIAKHPLEKRDIRHPVYTNWRGFPWLDIQTGIRATNICRVFGTMVHAQVFTPEFLGILLASLYDHQVKTEILPMGVIHNKAVFEQRGFVNIVHTFPEFKDSRRWMDLAVERTRDSLLAQTTSDGVQREWSAGYHQGVLRDAVEIMGHAESFGAVIPEDYRARVRGMYDYIFAAATPDLGWAMFGDVSRPYPASSDRRNQPLYGYLMQATEIFGDQKYTARANFNRGNLPDLKSYAFREAGMYFMRDDWGQEQIYFALHCSPPPVSAWHDQPDNGTFELYAYGRWLMTDTGFYTYGHDPEKRAWHRRTDAHQTLTLDGGESRVDASLLLWQTSENFDALVVENKSYEGLTHRRTVWFVDRKFFIILDEALGTAEGGLDLHYQLAAGDASIDTGRNSAVTLFDDTNVLVWMPPDAPVTMSEEEGWFAWKYGSRTPRKAFRYRHDSGAPAYFLTVLAPYRGKKPPDVTASVKGDLTPGENRVTIETGIFGESWEIGRDLERDAAWCTRR